MTRNELVALVAGQVAGALLPMLAETRTITSDDAFGNPTTRHTFEIKGDQAATIAVEMAEAIVNRTEKL